MQRKCSHGKNSTLQNIPKPRTAYDGNLCVMSAFEDLLLGLDVALIRAKHHVKDIEKCVSNLVVNGKKKQEEIKQLAKKCNKTEHDIIIVPWSEFRNGFAMCKSLIANEGLLLHALTIQSRDSSCNSLFCTYHIALENKSKDSTITESACINDISNREDPTT